MKTTRIVVGQLLMIMCVISVGESEALAKNDSQALAGRIVSLMQRALEARLPETLPEQVRREVPEHVARDYERYNRLLPGEGFFIPEALQDMDHGLYRELKQMWKLKPAQLIEVVPYLEEPYFGGELSLKRLIIGFVGEVSDEAYAVPTRDALLEPFYVHVLDRSVSREDKMEVAEYLFGKIRVSPAGYGAMVGLVKKYDHSDPDLRVAILQVLAEGRSDNIQPKAVGSFLLDVAANDSCKECRRAAISYWQIRYLGADAVVPTYLSVLRSSVNEGDWATAMKVVRVVGIQWKDIGSVPQFIETLDASDPTTRATSVTALESVVGIDKASVPTDVQVFSIDYEKEKVEAQAMRRLDRACARWRVWWGAEGRQLFERVGREEFSKKAHDVYGSGSTG